MDAPDVVRRLVDHFDSERDQLVSGSYNETQIRREFIDPFFSALGWDIDNRQGAAEAYKDVVHEDAIKVGSATKAPDYSFRIGGTRKFFVEAKKPSVKIKEDVAPAFQLRRYAWSAKLPVSILTDFDELAVYDCRVKPNKTDKPATARIKYLTYKDYITHWEEIHSTFSRDAVWKGSFDKFVGGTKGKRGTDEVDDAFLKEIESWRDVLARNIALRNPRLSVQELNSAVQRTIDRIIFLRICEDRGIETYGALQALVNGERIYKRLGGLFQRADEKYNSGLFHFAPEKGRPENDDAWTLDLKIDDKVFKDILTGLYYPDCPYEFSILPADILGQVYEQFLGKVIRLTAGHQAKVEEKPEVKKAGGVYYTPTYIVDYIVKNTVGKLVEGKTPKEVSSLRILDPACGSGSFLIGAYQYLLDWHLEWYIKDSAEKWSKGKNATLYAAQGGGWRMTTAERKRILLNNIYGVDIDSQAVDVTKLSLLLKVLEGENYETITLQLKMFHERALPDLGSNIKCGNSLIGPEFVNGQLTTGQEIWTRYSAFEWKSEFKRIMDEGGFDGIVGNPPYVDVKILGEDLKSLLTKWYRSATRRFDLYVPFVERSLDLVKPHGLLAFIIPSMFAKREYGRGLRNVILNSASIEQIVDFGTNQVFSNAMNYVGIFVFRKDSQRQMVRVIKFDHDGLSQSQIAQSILGKGPSVADVFEVKREAFVADSAWHLSDMTSKDFFTKMSARYPTLESLLRNASEGIHSGKDEVFFPLASKVKEFGLETPPVYPLAKGKDVHRYQFIDPSLLEHCVVYPYDLDTGEVLGEETLRLKARKTWQYLEDSKPLLKGRSYFDRSCKQWYELWNPREPRLFTSGKIVGPEIANKGEFTLCRNQLFVNNKVKVLITKSETAEAPEYILGLLNSALMVYLHRLIAPQKGGGYFEVKTRILRTLPIRTIRFTDPADKAYHEEMIGLVRQMLSLHEKLGRTKLDHESAAVQRQIDVTDRRIDVLVYDLYDLTEEEIRIVEGDASGKS